MECLSRSWIYYTAETNAVLLVLSLGKGDGGVSVDGCQLIHWKTCLVLSLVFYFVCHVYILESGQWGVGYSTELLVLTHANTISQHP